GDHAGRVGPRQAQPLDGPVRRDQAALLAIRQQRVVGNGRKSAHLCPYLSHSRPHVLHTAVLAGWSGAPLSLYAPDGNGMSSMVKVRSRRMSRTKAGHQLKMAPRRLRRPGREPLWMNSQAHQPTKPPNCSPKAETTACPREM